MASSTGGRFTLRPPTIRVCCPIKKWLESFYTIQFANYPVDASYLSNGGVAVACHPRP